MNQKLANIIGIVIVALVIGGIVGYSIAGKQTVPANMKETPSAMVSNDSSSGDRTSPEWKIKNAMSAAPEAISKDATVVDWPSKEGEAFSTLRQGTNGWTCIPDYPVSPGNDPFCGDAMSMQWFDAYMNKKTPAIAQAGLAYMLQGGSDPSNTDPFATEPKPGESWMSAPPHIMVFPTTPPDAEVYGTDPDSGGPWVMWANTPYAHLMMPVK